MSHDGMRMNPTVDKLLGEHVCVCVYSHSVGLFELPNLLNLIHEISSVYVLHDKIQAILWGIQR